MWFIGLAIAVIVGAAWRANRDQRRRPNGNSDDETRWTILHARQDIQLLCYLTGGVILMLGIIADRLH